MKKKIIVEAAGRINLIGEHVDYNGGSVLPASIDKKIIIEFHSVSGKECNIESKTLDKVFNFKYYNELKQQMQIKEEEEKDEFKEIFERGKQ